MELVKNRSWLRTCLLVVAAVVVFGGGFLMVRNERMATSASISGSVKDGNHGNNAYFTNTIRYSAEVIDKLACQIVHEKMDLLKMKKLPFERKFKNPCWYRKGTLQCLPYMYLVGVAKCGTTDLYNRLQMHPDFVNPTAKENNWMSYSRFFKNKSFRYYTSTYFSPLAKALTASNSTQLITGDFSINILEGSHLWQCLGNNVGKMEPVETNAEYIYHMNKEARIIINVRDPVERLWSEYLMFSSNENKSAERFHEHAKLAIQTYKDCFKVRSQRSCLYDRPLAKLDLMAENRRMGIANGCFYKHDENFFLRRGIYHVYIKDFLKVFPRKHVLVERVEDFKDNVEKALTRTYKFLGLRIPPTMQKIVNQGVRNERRPTNKEKGDMLDATRKMLNEFYMPHNKQLSRLLKNKKYNYGPSWGT